MFSVPCIFCPSKVNIEDGCFINLVFVLLLLLWLEKGKNGLLTYKDPSCFLSVENNL